MLALCVADMSRYLMVDTFFGVLLLRFLKLAYGKTDEGCRNTCMISENGLRWKTISSVSNRASKPSLNFLADRPPLTLLVSPLFLSRLFCGTVETA